MQGLCEPLTYQTLHQGCNMGAHLNFSSHVRRVAYVSFILYGKETETAREEEPT